jgi:hypothetical protein
MVYLIRTPLRGSRIMGFRLQTEVDVGECMQYAEKVFYCRISGFNRYFSI